jgi:hypothetical protein
MCGKRKFTDMFSKTKIHQSSDTDDDDENDRDETRISYAITQRIAL